MTKTPAKTAIAACLLVVFWTISPRRNNPKIPPLKIDANAHHASNALATPLNAKPTRILANPIAKDEIHKTRMEVFSDGFGWIYFLK